MAFLLSLRKRSSILLGTYRLLLLLLVLVLVLVSLVLLGERVGVLLLLLITKL